MKRLDYARLVKDSRAWFGGTCKARMWDSPRAELARFIDAGLQGDGIGAVIRPVRTLTAWHARKGCVLIADGDATEGWQQLGRFFHYRTWIMRVLVARVKKGPSPNRNTADATMNPFHLLGMAIAFRDEECSKWLGNLIIHCRGTNCLLGHAWGNGRGEPFKSYLTELYERSGGQEALSAGLGAYEGVFASWSKPAELLHAIHAICNYHVQQIRADGEFENNPHDIFPSEILALYRVREKLGLETPWVNHPLLDTPFTQVPEKITYEPDPLVVQAMDLVTKLLPEAVARR